MPELLEEVLVDVVSEVPLLPEPVELELEVELEELDDESERESVR